MRPSYLEKHEGGFVTQRTASEPVADTSFQRIWQVLDAQVAAGRLPGCVSGVCTGWTGDRATTFAIDSCSTTGRRSERVPPANSAHTFPPDGTPGILKKDVQLRLEGGCMGSFLRRERRSSEPLGSMFTFL